MLSTMLLYGRANQERRGEEKGKEGEPEIFE